MRGHELLEVLLGVLAALALLEQLVEVREHRVDGGAVLVGGVLEGLLHALEALVEQLAAQQVLDLLVGLACLRALPVVGAQLADRGRGVGRQAVELHLAQRPVAVVHGDVAGQLLALLEHRGVEQLADLLQGAVEVVLGQQLAAALGDPPGQVVEALAVAGPAAQQLAQRALGAVAGHHVLADLVERLGEVDRGRERVGAAVVAAVARRASLRPDVSHTRSHRARRPC